MKEDKILMKEFQDGNEESFEKLVIKYRNSAVYFSSRYTMDKYIAEDIVQEAFAYIYVYKDKYNEKHAFKTYLFTIIRNKSIDYIRKISNESLNDDLNEIKSREDPEQKVLEKEKKSFILKKLNLLKEEYRTVIYLIDYEEFSYKEAAVIMNKNLASIKILIFRARKKLKSLIEQEGYTVE